MESPINISGTVILTKAVAVREAVNDVDVVLWMIIFNNLMFLTRIELRSFSRRNQSECERQNISFFFYSARYCLSFPKTFQSVFTTFDRFIFQRQICIHKFSFNIKYFYFIQCYRGFSSIICSPTVPFIYFRNWVSFYGTNEYFGSRKKNPKRAKQKSPFHRRRCKASRDIFAQAKSSCHQSMPISSFSRLDRSNGN